MGQDSTSARPDGSILMKNGLPVGTCGASL